MPTTRTLDDTDDVVGHARADLTQPVDSLFHRLVSTSGSATPTIARLTLGLVMLPHALQKALGWFGGYGFTGTYRGFTEQMHIPGPLALLAIVTEITATVALILGVGSRLAAAGIIMVMLGAIFTVHAPYGFFMNWGGQQAGEGFEYHLLAIGLGLVVVLAGGGARSLDRILMTRRPMAGGAATDLASD